MTSITSDSPRPVCQVDGLVSGFPCTSASCLNMSAQGFQDHSSATGGGFHNVKQVRQAQKATVLCLGECGCADVQPQSGQGSKANQSHRG